MQYGSSQSRVVVQSCINLLACLKFVIKTLFSLPLRKLNVKNCLFITWHFSFRVLENKFLDSRNEKFDTLSINVLNTAQRK